MSTTTASMLMRRGLALEYAPLSWNVVETAVLVAAALGAGSVALAGFGLDSLIEIGASMVVIWHLNDAGVTRERHALRLNGIAFVALAIYSAFRAAYTLITASHLEHSTLGIAWTAIPCAVMRALAPDGDPALEVGHIRPRSCAEAAGWSIMAVMWEVFRGALFAAMLALVVAPMSAPAATRHAVSAKWEIGFSGIDTGHGTIGDTFAATGAPFGRSRVVAETPQEQVGEAVRTPTFKGEGRRGTYRGHLTVELDHVLTTETRAVTKYKGTGVFEGGTGAFRHATGKITRITGESDCIATGCDGTLTVTGWVRY